MINFLLNYLSPRNFKNDILSGLTVALALIPEAIAFAIVAKVDPMVGLYAAFIVSFVAGLLSGRPGMISGATGALAVVMTSLVIEHGVQYLFATVVLMGIIQILISIFKLGKFAKIIPYPVMLGFVNGLAIVIFLSQIPQLQVQTPEGIFGFLKGDWLPNGELLLMMILIAVTMAIIYFLPKLTKIIPSSLFAIFTISVIVIVFDVNTPTVKDMLNGKSIDSGFPSFIIPNIPYTLETLKIILPYAFILALIGLIESLMTLTLIDEITNTKGNNNRECLAQGSANIITGFLGGMGGCAMVGQSMININSRGRGRLSGITAGFALLCFILFAGSLIEKIPLATLVGVMIMVVIGTFAWSSFRIIKKIPKSDAFVLVLVSVVTVFSDLAFAVILGIIVSALVFSWKKSQYIFHKEFIDENGSKHYEIEGIVFFGSIHNFRDIFSIDTDPKEIFINFKNARIFDHSAIEALNKLTESYRKSNKTLHLKYLSPDCQKLLKNAKDFIEVNIKEDPKYKVADE